jgi:parallel beta-helix repeat protein
MSDQAACRLSQRIPHQYLLRFLWALLLSLIVWGLVAALPAAAQLIVYENDFENPADPLREWSNPLTDVTPAGGRRFLGQFGNETVSFTLENLPPHVSVTVSFELFIIQSWDGNSSPDIWSVSIGTNSTLLSTTFSNHEDTDQRQAFPGTYPSGDYSPLTGAEEIDTLGYSFQGDSVYHLSFTFPHSTTSLILHFIGSPDQDISDESWGLDNVRVTITPATTIPVTNTADSGAGSLRQAILDANANEEIATAIVFNIPTTDPGFDGQVFTIQPQTPLPIIERPTIIDATSQTAFSGDSNPLGPEVVLNGSLLDSGSGLVISGDRSFVGGLVINGFPDDGISMGFAIDSTPSQNQIVGNYIGTDHTGTIPKPNGTGISVHGFGSPDQQARSTTIESNLIAGNSGRGISLCDAADTRIVSNRIGTDRDTAENLGNGSHGIHLLCAGAPRTVITDNTIAFNGGDGVRDDPDYRFEAATTPDGHLGNAIRFNSIFANEGLGINLNPPPFGTDDGVTPNDPCDADEGANGMQNYPVLTLAVSNGGSTAITGTLNSKPNQSFEIDLYTNDQADASGFGEGRNHLGSFTVSTDSACQASFTTIMYAGTLGQWVTATATAHASNSTSEFSEALAVVSSAPSCQGGVSQIRGRVTYADAPKGLPDVTVAFLRIEDACQEATTTRLFGGYRFANLHGGTYIVVPSKDGCRFDPPSVTVGLWGGDAQLNFEASCP